MHRELHLTSTILVITCQVAQTTQPSKSKGKKKVEEEDPPEFLMEVDMVLLDDVPEDATPHPVELIRRIVPSTSADDPCHENDQDQFWKSEMERIEKLVAPYSAEGKAATQCIPIE